MINKAYVIIVLVLLKLNSSAQDGIFSQFYNAPNYLNPALNGQFDGDLRINLIHRAQTVSLQSPMNYSSFSVDYNVPQFGGGFGVIGTRSREGQTEYTRTTLAGIYSYSAIWDYAVLSFGVSAGVGNLKYDQSKAVYYDQILENGEIEGSSPSAIYTSMNNRYYFDSGAGANLVAGDIMMGLAIHHLNRANESFSNVESKIPMRINAHASYHFSLDDYDTEEGPALIPSVVYYKQYNLQSVSAGVQFKTKRIKLGGWYRSEFRQKNSIIFSLSLDLFSRSDSYDKVRLGISHDAIVSKLGYSATGGSTEGALTWETNTRGDDSGSRRENYGKRCYDFY